jgi:endonuclease YncB( thermonuclease family)
VHRPPSPNLLGHGDVWCEFKRTGRGTVRHDIYGRILAVCGAGKVEANDWLVRQGFAWSYRKMKAYKAAEAEARAAERGVWSGQSQQPWEWRKQEY